MGKGLKDINIPTNFVKAGSWIGCLLAKRKWSECNFYLAVQNLLLSQGLSFKLILSCLIKGEFILQPEYYSIKISIHKYKPIGNKDAFSPKELFLKQNPSNSK